MNGRSLACGRRQEKWKCGSPPAGMGEPWAGLDGLRLPEKETAPVATARRIPAPTQRSAGAAGCSDHHSG